MKKLAGFLIVIFSAFLMNGCYTQFMWENDPYATNYVDDSDNEPEHVCVDYGTYTNYYADAWWLPSASGIAVGSAKGVAAKKGTKTGTVRNDGLDTPTRNVPSTNNTLPTASGAGSGSGGSSGGGTASSQSGAQSTSTSNRNGSDSRTDTRNDNGNRSTPTNKDKK